MRSQNIVDLSQKFLMRWRYAVGLALPIAILGIWFVQQREQSEAALPDFQPMRDDLLTTNDRRGRANLACVIRQLTAGEEWREFSGTNSTRASMEIMTACSSNGCETFVSAADGTWLPIQSKVRTLDSSKDNPFEERLPEQLRK